MISRRIHLGALLFLAYGWIPAASSAAPHDVIICGSGGEEAYRTRFEQWGGRLSRVLIEKFNHPAANVHLMTEPGEGAPASEHVTSLESIRTVMRNLAAQAGAADDLFVYLIGHGSYLQRVSKFQIPGPDMTATEFGSLLKEIHTRRIVLINGSSASAGFINELSAPGRTICTATKSTEENNATEFMEHFIHGLEDGSADRDRDDRITVLEACAQGAELTAAWYLAKGLLATEHPLLDDDGDGLGTRPVEILENRKKARESGDAGIGDGAIASAVFIKDFSFSPLVPRELVDRYLAALDRVELLKLEKGKLAPEEYQKKLEALLLEAARLNRDIHRLSEPSAP